jgi:hypothetical protein
MLCGAGHQADPLSTGRPNALRHPSLEDSLSSPIKCGRSIDHDHHTADHIASANLHDNHRAAE